MEWSRDRRSEGRFFRPSNPFRDNPDKSFHARALFLDLFQSSTFLFSSLRNIDLVGRSFKCSLGLRQILFSRFKQELLDEKEPDWSGS